MILVDSSAWIEYSRATGSATDVRLTHLIRSRREEIAVTDPILMELLAGARPSSDRVTERLVRSFIWLPFDPVSDFAGAARIYQACWTGGVTPGGLVDCMIVQVALRTGASVLAADHDFEEMARILPLRIEAN